MGWAAIRWYQRDCAEYVVEYPVFSARQTCWAEELRKRNLPSSRLPPGAEERCRVVWALVPVRCSGVAFGVRSGIGCGMPER